MSLETKPSEWLRSYLEGLRSADTWAAQALKKLDELEAAWVAAQASTDRLMGLFDTLGQALAAWEADEGNGAQAGDNLGRAVRQAVEDAVRERRTR